MSRLRWVASLLIAYHLVALTVASIPDPQSLKAVPNAPPPETDALPRAIAPTLHRVARAVSFVQPSVFAAVEPLRRVTKPYIAAGVGEQRWNMFSSPDTVDQYVRVDSYVSGDPKSGDLRLVRELILPADREHDVRVRHRFRDKAILSALEKFSVDLTDLRSTSTTTAATVAAAEQAGLLRTFEPITRYARQRVARAAGERVVRTELWYGEAPIPPRGQRLPDEVITARLEIIEAYREGRTSPHPPSGLSRTSRRGTTEREADLHWILLYVDEP